MKYKINNGNVIPKVGSFIMVIREDKNIIGIVENVIDEHIIILMLDRNGYVKIKLTDEWLILNIPNLVSLRNKYKLFIDNSIDNRCQTRTFDTSYLGCDDLLLKKYERFARKYDIPQNHV
jgi:hypothetical protein